MAFSASVYPVPVIKKAAYRLLDKAAFDIRPSGEDIICIVSFDQPVTEDEAVVFRNALLREVHDQDLRGAVAAETEAIRNAILAYAFSGTSLVDKQ